MILYGRPFSGYTQKVRIALEEWGLREEIEERTVTREDSKAKPHVDRHPLGLVPVLELDDGRTIAESNAIIEFFEAQGVTPSLLPKDPYQGAKARFFDAFNDQALTPTVRPFILSREGRDVSARDLEDFRVRLLDVLAYLDRSLADTTFLAGDEFSLGDIGFMPRLQLFGWLDVDVPDRYENLARWIEALQGRKSWQATELPRPPWA